METGEMLGRRFEGTIAVLLLTALIASGCGTIDHKVQLEKGYRVQPGTKVAIGSVKKTTEQVYDFDIEKTLRDALTEALKERNLLWTSDPTPKLVMRVEILNYQPGDAFQRWLAPGSGSGLTLNQQQALRPGSGATVIQVWAILTDSDNRKVGTAYENRSVTTGGAYTIGAGSMIFRDVAEDLATDLESELTRAK